MSRELTESERLLLTGFDLLGVPRTSAAPLGAILDTDDKCLEMAEWLSKNQTAPLEEITKKAIEIAKS